jgi:acyl-CoA synthetase (AMP-forming)/AMP-acid ligase II
MMLLEMASSAFGDRVALASGDDQWTYAELFAAAGSAAAEVSAAGMEQLALIDVSSPALPVGLFASAWAGVPFVPLNYRLTEAEIESLVGRISPAYLVTDSERVATLSKLPATTVASRSAFLENAASKSAPAPAWPMDPDGIALLLFTSGTTGAPKAAVLRHKHLVSYILGSVEFGAAGEDDSTLVSVPPYHVAGVAAVLSSVYAGRRIVQLPNFSAEDWIDLARRERVTNAFVVPTMLARIVECLEKPDSVDLPCLRAMAYGGGKMPLPIIERALQLLPATSFTNAYGLTETSSTISVLGPEEHRAALASDDETVKRRLASVGRPLPGVEVEIHDETGRRLDPGGRGEIHVRGDQVSGEYLGRGVTLGPDGWFSTRDGGSMDADGYLFVEGRIDDVIVRGGENISPGEIEDVLLEHEAVADCAVVGIPDEHWGEAVAAAVVLQKNRPASPEELRTWVKSRLRSSRTPERIEFSVELPYSETGKLLRREVRAQFRGDSS